MQHLLAQPVHANALVGLRSSEGFGLTTTAEASPIWADLLVRGFRNHTSTLGANVYYHT